MSTLPNEFVKPSFELYTFSDSEIHSATVHFQVIKLNECLMLWAGTDDSFTNLCVAMPPRDPISSTQGVGSLLFGNALRSTAPAQRLAKRTNKQVHLSINVSSVGTNMQTAESMVEMRFAKEIGEHPEHF
eukprot:CFRG7090T1